MTDVGPVTGQYFAVWCDTVSAKRDGDSQISFEEKRALDALSKVLDQEARSVLVGQLLHTSHKLDAVAAALTVAEAPIALEPRGNHKAARAGMVANGARTSQLIAGLPQLDAEQIADLLDRDSLPQGLEVHTLVGAHWYNLSVVKGQTNAILSVDASSLAERAAAKEKV